MRNLTIMIVAGLLAAPTAFPQLTPKEKKELELQLDRVTTPELPATVVAILKRAEPASKNDTVDAALNFVAQKRPSAVPLVVSAVADAEPALSEAAIDSAKKVSPGQARQIERAGRPTDQGNGAANRVVSWTNPRAQNPGNGQNQGKPPGQVTDTPGHIQDTLPNGKPRPIRPEPPRRPDHPPRPVPYNRPADFPGNPNPPGNPERPGPPGGHPVFNR